MISRETIDEVLRRVSIVDLVSQYTEVKHKGSTYTACCPFHNEKTPSFHMNPEKGVYHCFGCGVSGNIFSFVMNMTGTSFVDAVTELATKFNIEIKYTEGKVKDNRKDIENLYKINALAQKFFSYSLKTNFKILSNYLKERGFTDKIIKDFYIGYSPDNWTALYEFLKKAKVPENLMETSGLFYRNKNGELFDVFRGRLMFPILSMPQKIAGFGGRVIPGLTSEEDLKKYPKYLNSKESLIYEKSKILYNFYRAREEIKRQKIVFLVEGYMDVVGLSKVNINNVVATCGTSLTVEHAKKLEGLGANVIVMFDADNAGYNAAARAFDIFLNIKLNTKAVFLPQGEDPDSIAKIKGEGTLEFLKSIKGVSLLEAFILKQLRDEGLENIKEATPTIKEKICDKVVETISKITSDIRLIETMKDASFILQVPVEILQNNLKKYKANISNIRFFNNKANEEKKEEVKDLRLSFLDKEIIRVVLCDENLLKEILLNATLCEFLSPSVLEFLTILDDIFHKERNSDEDAEIEDYDDARLQSVKNLIVQYGREYVVLWNEILSKKQEFNSHIAYQECLATVKKKKKEALIKKLTQELELAQDEETKMRLLNELLEIKKIK